MTTKSTSRRNTYTSPKYKHRSLKQHEINRYFELRWHFEKLNEKQYHWEVVNEKTKETLQDIACSKNRYEGALKWLIEKRKEKHFNTKKKTQSEENEKREVVSEFVVRHLLEMLVEDFDQDSEMTTEEEKTLEDHHKKITEIARKIILDRNEKYWDSWKVLSIQSLANLCEMKLNRIAKLWVDAKTEDELIDVINYCVFGYLKINDISIK